MLFLLIAFSWPAHATEWTMLTDESTLHFSVQVGDRATHGEFRRFAARIRLDPDAPEQGNIVVTVDLTSLETSDPNIAQAARSALWLSTNVFGTATYTSHSVERVEAGKFVAHGRLSVKGVQKPLSLPFELRVAEGKGRAKGQVHIARSDFGIGPAKSDNAPVDDLVTLRFSVVARAKPN